MSTIPPPTTRSQWPTSPATATTTFWSPGRRITPTASSSPATVAAGGRPPSSTRCPTGPRPGPAPAISTPDIRNGQLSSFENPCIPDCADAPVVYISWRLDGDHFVATNPESVQDIAEPKSCPDPVEVVNAVSVVGYSVTSDRVYSIQGSGVWATAFITPGSTDPLDGMLEDRNGPGWRSWAPCVATDFAVETDWWKWPDIGSLDRLRCDPLAEVRRRATLGSRKRSPNSRRAEVRVLAPAVPRRPSRSRPPNVSVPRGPPVKRPTGSARANRPTTFPAAEPFQKVRFQTVIAHYEVRADSAVRARDVALRRAKADGARRAVVLSVSAADPWRQHDVDHDLSGIAGEDDGRSAVIGSPVLGAISGYLHDQATSCVVIPA